MMRQVIPKIFYAQITDGLRFFVQHLNFTLRYQDDTLAVIERDGVKLYLVQSAEFAAKDRPELTIETDHIHMLYEEITARAPHILHPNGRQVTKKLWGATEFAVLDETDVCVIFRQW